MSISIVIWSRAPFKTKSTLKLRPVTKLVKSEFQWPVPVALIRTLSGRVTFADQPLLAMTVNDVPL